MVVQGHPDGSLDDSGYQHRFLSPPPPGVPSPYQLPVWPPVPTLYPPYVPYHQRIQTSHGMSQPQPERSLTSAPLTEAELQQLQNQLRADGVSDTFTRLVDQPSTSQAQPDWMYHTPSQEMALAIGRADTLERNPGFVNPNDVSGSSAGGHFLLPTSESIAQQHAQAVFEYSGQADPPAPSSPAQPETPSTQVQLLRVNTDNTCTVITNLNTTWGGDTMEEPHTAAHPQHEAQSSTSAHPSIEQWSGDCDFKISFNKSTKSNKNKTWDFSEDLNKLFIDMGKYVQIAFSVNTSQPEGLFVRVLPIFDVPSFLTDPVKRCPNHASTSDASNQGFPHEFREHLIRVNHDGAIYDEDAVSQRLSVRVPFVRPQVGSTYSEYLFKFMCLGSDVGGINRKPVKLIFTLERGPETVLGRVIIDLRICSCPKRDRHQEEEKFNKDRQKLLGAAEGLARSNSVFTKPSSKKRKLLDLEEFVMVPVSKKDFEKVNELAEAAMIVRNPSRANHIKDERRRLLDMHNKKLINKS